MSSLALDIFDRLIGQVDQVEAVARQADSEPTSQVAPILRRSAFVLAVASIDTFFHEHAAALLYSAAQRSAGEAGAVANYCRNVSASDVAGPAGESHIRVRLSYKTLVAPRSIDAALTAAGLDADEVWRDVAFGMASRPDRLRLQLELSYDRRNQIAHEGDWDLVQLEFRPMAEAHLADCTTFLRALASEMDVHL